MSYRFASYRARLFLVCLPLASMIACGDDAPAPAAADASPARDAGELPTDPVDAGPPKDDAATVTTDDETSLEPEAGTGTTTDQDAGFPTPTALAFNEIMAKNDGAWIDEVGETDDWIELVNISEGELLLADFSLGDSSGARVTLPEMTLAAGEVVVLWADDTTEQGPLHLPFKLAAEGDELTLRDAAGAVVDRVQFGELLENEASARIPDGVGPWQSCRYATPTRSNGQLCAPAPAPEPPPAAEFSEFTFPEPFPVPTSSLVVSELALRPVDDELAFFELLNRGNAAIDLASLQARLSVHAPGLAWPGAAMGDAVTLPSATLAAGERVQVSVPAEALTALNADPAFEGVLTLFDADGAALERVDFMRWPEGTALTRLPDDTGLFRFCHDVTPGAENSCDPVLSRDVGDRIRYLRTPGDFAALATGATEIGIDSVKFIVDLEAGGVVHLLSSARWALHYTFVRELVYGQAALDRCDAAQQQEFYEGWVEFSRTEYYQVEGRRFLLGTLTLHGSTGLQAVEYTQGDVIVGEQMLQGFMSVIPHTQDPTEWVLHPHDAAQAQTALSVDGQLPIVDPNAPYIGLTYQPLTEGIAYGTLRFVPVGELKTVALGPDIIVVTDDVPNDIPLVGGLITEAFQTPLAHVNVLSQSRGTPNAALKNARQELAPYLEKLVRWEVRGAELMIEEADPAEAQLFWESRIPDGPSVSPRLDTSVRGVQSLADHNLASLPMIGAKASQLAELGKVNIAHAGCAASTVPINVPDAGFAIPLVHYIEHFENSGAKQLLAELQEEESFNADPLARAEALAEVRQAMLDYPVDAALLAEVMQEVEERFGRIRLRFRSSSNTEDLPGFNGAGLYTSIAGELDSDADRLDDGIRTVWASLWNARAYDERRYARIDDALVAMGVLVHPAYVSERANGVAVSRNVLDPTRGDIYYINVQAGEASVTNPAPSVTTEQLVYRWGRTPRVMWLTQSSLLPALAAPQPETVLTENEASRLACALGAVHDWFLPLLDPDGEDPWFTMEVEFKFMGPERTLAIKQARPHTFANRTTFGDCREL